MKPKGMVYVIIYLILIVFIFAPAYSRYYKMKAHLSDMQSDIKRLKKENIDLQRRIHQIEVDSGALEEIARRKYRMGSPGEIIYIISAEDEG